ncbi:MAG: hypothetical protein HYX89_08400 [Chloroflexi bacterium]|nr:hypothetical protein [Chloroflexota bacterium]
MSRDYAEAHPEIALPAARAVFKGIQLIQQKENDAKAVARQLFPDLDPQVFEEVWRAGYPSFSKDGVPTKEGTKKHIDVISAFADQPLKVTPEDVLLPRYAEQAKRELAEWRH